PYTICRALPVVEATSRGFNDVLLHILTSRRLSYTPYDSFDCFMNQRSLILSSKHGTTKSRGSRA
ncbi:hypothetical protein DFP72DRAFT_831759, partial [Ephemerocybe angulata]